MDIVYKGRFTDLNIAFQYAITTDLANQIVGRHQCDPVATHLLVRALTAGLLAAASGGGEERINIRWTYGGSLQAILVDAGADGTIRGLINPPQFGEGGTVDALFGDRGDVRVVRSRGGRVLASGTVEACFMDVMDDLAAFLCMSDQVESSGTAVLALTDDPQQPVRIARGLLLHALPQCDLEQFQIVRDRLNVPEVREWMTRTEESAEGLEALLRSLVAPLDTDPAWTMATASKPRFRCSCGADKMGPALRSLPYADRVDIVAKKEPVHIRCHFCNERYSVPVEMCIKAWNEPRQPASAEEDK